MLVPSMNRREVTAEVIKDISHLNSVTLRRLFDEYARERQKLKIDKAKDYARHYSIKTASKNPWLISIKKCASKPKFQGVQDAMAWPVTYFYSKIGLQVFNYYPQDTRMDVYNGHFFVRYNQRMNLNLNSLTDVIKYYFEHNGHLSTQLIHRDDGIINTVSVCKDGMALGVHLTDPFWIIHNTFISNDLKKKSQQKMEAKMLHKIQKEILNEKLGIEPFDMQTHKANLNLMAQLSQRKIA